MELKRKFMPSLIMENLKEYGNCSFTFKETSLGNEEVFKGLEIAEENVEVKAYAIKRRGSITVRKEATYEEILIALAKSITSSLK